MSQTDPHQSLVVSYLTMRKAIGWLGMLLPFVLLIGNGCINGLDILNSERWIYKQAPCYVKYTADPLYKSSISHYYYSTVGELFTGTLCAVALFMFCYKGHPKRHGEWGPSEGHMTNLAAFFALGVVIFPTSSDGCISDNIRTYLSTSFTGYIHFTFAALFFIALALLSMVYFRRSEQLQDFGKGKNDNFYLGCGITMLVCLTIIFIYAKFVEGRIEWLDKFPIIFIFEAVALIAFGLSWLTKGRVDYLFIPKKLGLMKK